MEKLFTERAHLMCPNMNFAIAIKVNAPFDEEKIKISLQTLSKAHPFLRSLLGYDPEDNSYYYDITDASKAELTVSGDDVTGIYDDKVKTHYEMLISREWDIREEGMLKVTSWKSEDKTVFLLVFHHLIADGRGALELACELSDLYVSGKEPKTAEEKLIGMEDLPVDSKMPWISRMLVNKANKDFAKENCEKLSYGKYLEYADKFIKNDNVIREVRRISEDEMKEILKKSKNSGVTVNDLLMAKMYIEDDTDNIIIASDLRDKLKSYNKGALGNYSTAFGVRIKAKDQDEAELAGKIHKKVQKIMAVSSDLWLVLQCYANLDPAVLDGAFMAARGEYESKASEFIGKMFFHMDSSSGYSITNLGKTDNMNIEEAFFMPPASPAIKKTSGVLTVNGKMSICTCRR